MHGDSDEDEDDGDNDDDDDDGHLQKKYHISGECDWSSQSFSFADSKTSLQFADLWQRVNADVCKGLVKCVQHVFLKFK